MSIFGLVLGIVGLIGGIVVPLLTGSTVAAIIFIVVAVIGIILSVVGMKSGKNHGAGVAGLVLSIIAVIVAIIMTIACVGGNKVVDTISQELSTVTEEQIESVFNEALEGATAEEATTN